ncbi:GlxA family transcriptional regulator [Litoreibacter halocynthiae]|uniref:GlxA family transcriptional regulator n=1 Tax=Litoreibacter halocynthiae TaxID=1242689 RepID=UPI0024914F6A|nr:helix-turn-helix domain-containing protein [Litoreibacter halocynthiae]
MNDNMTSISAKLVAFVVFPNLKLLDITGPMQVFADANQISPGQYDLKVVSANGGAIPSDAVLPVATDPISSLKGIQIDTVIVAGGAGAFAAAEDGVFIEQIRDLAARTGRLGSVCTGAFILAKAGLLVGRSAVTHWDSCDRLRDSFADITVQEDAIYIKDGDIWTSAGVTAGIDMSLAMVAEDIGRKHALELARSLVCYLVRPGGQSQFSGPLQQQIGDSTGKFDDLNIWISDNLTSDLSVETLAEQVRMSPRNFARRYKQHLGVSPAKAVEALRVDAACRLLEETELPLTVIANRCGFFDDERLRRALMRSRNVAPGVYRERFRTGPGVDGGAL